MDTLSHGLWAIVAVLVIRRTIKKKISLGWAFWLGIFPDLFAFGPFFIWAFWNMIFSGVKWAEIGYQRGIEPAQMNALPLHQLSSSLYNLSHSLIIFSLLFLLVWAIYRFVTKKTWKATIPYLLAGWLLHILADIPTHSYRFFPTPIFWPISAWKFNGFSWGQPWFMILNYSMLALCFFLLSRGKKKGK